MGDVDKPFALQEGSRIRVVAPASSPHPERLQRGIVLLRSLGFEVELAELVRDVRRRGYLSGHDEDRARVLTEAFIDPDVDGIVCSNGGYGCQRILPHLDFDLIKANPKPFVGFSDITALHLALQKEAGFVTFHGPMVGTEVDDGLARDWTRDHFLRALTTSEPLGPVENPLDYALIRSVRGGRASGEIIGGNLSLVAASLGTPWEIDTRGKVFFIEEWKEPPFTIDTMLMQLRLAGKFDDANAIVFGEFPFCKPTEPGSDLGVEEVVQDVTENIDIPVLYGVAAGHGAELATLPFGVKATVDGDACTLVIDEPAMRAPEKRILPVRESATERVF